MEINSGRQRQVRVPYNQGDIQMVDIKADSGLWHSNLLPEGIVERWLVSDGAQVASGTPVAEIRIEESQHEIIAPGNGVLRIRIGKDSVIDPGSVLAQIG